MVQGARSDCIYMNNAATSWPKPLEVLSAVNESLSHPFVGGGRSSDKHSQDYIWSARTAIADLLGVRNDEHVIFTHNATDALNLLIQGFVKLQSRPIHVLTSLLEHNSVLRPLVEMEKAGNISLSYLPLKGTSIDADAVEEMVLPDTKLAVINHGSNVLGSVQNLSEIGSYLQDRNIFVIADGAQTAGHIQINFDSLPIDAYVFTGHKALFGIPGTGGFLIRDPYLVAPVRFGGTGSDSSSLIHPQDLPERFEAGTHNFPGLAALAAGVEYIQRTGQQRIEKKGIRQARMMVEGLMEDQNIKIYNEKPDLPIISLNVNSLDNEDLGYILTRAYKIICRSGLHCAPLVHKAADDGVGSLRLSLSWFTSDDECRKVVAAVREVARSADSSVGSA